MSNWNPSPFTLAREMRVAMVVLALLFACGTIAFKLVGGPEWTVFDAFYMTAMTVTTVGYEEVHALDTAGRVVALGVMLTGVGIVLYLAASTAEALIAGRLFWRRRIARMVKRMTDHYIVCGYGRVGRAICRELEAHGRPYVVIDLHEPEPGTEIPHIMGDATDDDALEQAGLSRARGLVTVLASDADNVYTILAARVMRPDIFVVSRCSSDKSAGKLLAAGADRVINPHERGGLMMVQVMLRPQVVDFLEEVSRGTGLDIHLEQLEVSEASPLVGMRLRESPIRSELDVIVTAIVKAGGDRKFNPSPEERIQAGDLLIAMGRPESLDRLEDLARVRAAANQ